MVSEVSGGQPGAGGRPGGVENYKKHISTGDLGSQLI